jgi:hypothetical protein
MKPIQYKDCSTTICPTGGYCRGEKCAVFKWHNRYFEERVYFNDIKMPWYSIFRYKKFEELFQRARQEWEPPKNLEDGWCFVTTNIHWRCDSNLLYAEYQKLNPNPRWYCGLQYN